MKTNAYIFIFTAIIYNLIDLGNEKYSFINRKLLDDAWYCLIYAHLSFLFFKAKGKNKIIQIAFLVSASRLVYNFAIMINLIYHTKYRATFFVPFFALLLLAIDLLNTKWIYYLLKLAFGFTIVLLLYYCFLLTFKEW